jgi:pimeloyl-ACP methyl ester carboxylesterase
MWAAKATPLRHGALYLFRRDMIRFDVAFVARRRSGTVRSRSLCNDGALHNVVVGNLERKSMTTANIAMPPPSKALMMLEGRALAELGAFWMLKPWLSLAPRGDGHAVIVLPGLLGDDSSTRSLRWFLNEQGFTAHGWELGRNMGLRDGVEEAMVSLVERLYDERQEKVSLVGWSLGGLYARQLAKQMPDKIRVQISLGSPFAGSPKSTNAWRAYELASGHSADEAGAMVEGLADAPSVPSTSIYSRTDGVCAWQACLNTESETAENIEVYGSHCGLAHHPAAVYAIADRLAQREGEWKKFSRSGWRAMVFPAN